MATPRAFPDAAAAVPDGTVLSEPSYADAAARLARGFAEHDGPREAADLLERLAQDRAPVERALLQPWG